MTLWIFTPSLFLAFPIKLWSNKSQDKDAIVKCTQNTGKISKNILLIGIITRILDKEIHIQNPLNSIKIHSIEKYQNLEIGDLIYIRDSGLKLDSKSFYYLDQESSIEIGHRFLSDEIIPHKYRLGDLNLLAGLKELIKWGSKLDWIRFGRNNTGKSFQIQRSFKVYATFSKLIIINALGLEIQVQDFKDYKEFTHFLCTIRCDTCQKCNFRLDICIFCKSSLEFCTRTDLPDLRMEIDCIDGLKVVKLGKWCDLWFPEIVQFPILKSEYVYHRFNRTIKRIKELKQVSMVLQQVSKSYFLIDVE